MKKKNATKVLVQVKKSLLGMNPAWFTPPNNLKLA